MEFKKVLLWVLVIVLVLSLFFSFVYPKVRELVGGSSKSLAEIGMDTIEDRLSGKTNGGIIESTILKETGSPDAPKLNDEVNTMYFQENALGVILYYESFSQANGTEYPNLFFKKTSKGLMLDGVANAYVMTRPGYNFDGVELSYDFSKVPSITSKTSGGLFGMSQFQTLASISDYACLAWKNYTHNRFFVGPSKNEQQKYTNVVATGVGNIVENYFTRIFGWEMNLQKMTKENQTKNFLRYVNLLWDSLNKNQVNEHANTSAVVDFTNLFTKNIPTELQKNYPVSSEIKSSLGIDYWRFYAVNKYIDIQYRYKQDGKVIVEITTEPNEYITDYPKITPPKTTKMLTTVKLVNLNGANVNDVNFAKNPVTIEFKADNSTAQAIFDSVDDVITSQKVVLLANTKYTYKITSSYLCFSSFTGTATTGDKAQTLSFNYTYENGSVVVSLGLNAVGSIDFNSVNLRNTPVKITLSTGQTISWDRNENFDFRYSLSLPVGEVSYTILSDGLTFASTTGTFTVDAQNRVQLFNCGMTVRPDIELSSNLVFSFTSLNTGDKECLPIAFTTDTFNKLFVDKTASIDVYLYDGNTQYVLEPMNGYMDSASGLTKSALYVLPSNFIKTGYPTEEHPHKYSLQIKITSGGNVYLSNLYNEVYSNLAPENDEYIIQYIQCKINVTL